MALRTQVVDFVRVQIVEEKGKRATIGEISIMQEKAVVSLVVILEDVIYTIGIKARCTALDAVDLIASGKKKLGQVGTILASTSGD